MGRYNRVGKIAKKRPTMCRMHNRRLFVICSVREAAGTCDSYAVRVDFWFYVAKYFVSVLLLAFYVVLCFFASK